MWISWRIIKDVVEIATCGLIYYPISKCLFVMMAG
jgi:hypothetical protein